MKYIIFDLDDTLLNKDHKISKKTYATLKRLQAEGHLLVINTARNYLTSKSIFDEVDADYGIFNGGSLVYNKMRECIFEDSLLMPASASLVEKLNKVCYSISVDSNHFYCSDKDYAKKMENVGGVYFDFTQPFTNKVNKIVVASKNVDEIVAIANMYQMGVTTYNASEWHRIHKLGVSKWSGVLELLALTNGKIEDTITFGDDVGDLEMLEGAGIGVAMANSQPMVLDRIKHVTLSNNEDGVAYYLEQVLQL